jgi:hypothetical protein
VRAFPQGPLQAIGAIRTQHYGRHRGPLQ